jgi:uncharacterized protein (DUF4415 family)
MVRDKSLEPEFGTPDDENPEWTAEDFANARPLAEVFAELGYKVPGRPKAPVTKTPVNLRLDPEIVAHFKAGGAGWQTRINDILGRHVKSAQAAAKRKRA